MIEKNLCDPNCHEVETFTILLNTNQWSLMCNTLGCDNYYFCFLSKSCLSE